MSEPRPISDIYYPDPDEPGWYRWTPEGKKGFVAIYGDIRVMPLAPGRARVRIDPLANLNLVEADFAWATLKIMDVADHCAGGRVVSLLEGGYDLEALAHSSAAHVAALMQG